MEDTTKTFGRRLAAAMALSELDQQSLADILTQSGYRIKRGMVTYWLQGKAKRMPTDAIPYLADILDQTQEYIYGISDRVNLNPRKVRFNLGEVPEQGDNILCAVGGDAVRR